MNSLHSQSSQSGTCTRLGCNLVCPCHPGTKSRYKTITRYSNKLTDLPIKRNKENTLETKDYIIIALAIALFLLVVVLVMVGCYWKRRRNKDNAKTTENIEKRLQVNIYIL
jgi:heme/copper-type cytochrome/quinol oxidase subunit 2